MNKDLVEVLEKIAEEFGDRIVPDSKMYNLIDIGQTAERFGKPELKTEYEGVKAIVPILKPLYGYQNKEVKGKNLFPYAQLESGIAVPLKVAGDTGLQNKPYRPKKKMILNLSG